MDIDPTTNPSYAVSRNTLQCIQGAVKPFTDIIKTPLLKAEQYEDGNIWVRVSSKVRKDADFPAYTVNFYINGNPMCCMFVNLRHISVSCRLWSEKKKLFDMVYDAAHRIGEEIYDAPEVFYISTKDMELENTILREKGWKEFAAGKNANSGNEVILWVSQSNTDT
jgi:hypothetical protein